MQSEREKVNLNHQLASLYAAKDAIIDFSSIEPFKSDLAKIEQQIAKVELLLKENNDD